MTVNELRHQLAEIADIFGDSPVVFTHGPVLAGLDELITWHPIQVLIEPPSAKRPKQRVVLTD